MSTEALGRGKISLSAHRGWSRWDTLETFVLRPRKSLHSWHNGMTFGLRASGRRLGLFDV